MVLSGSTGRRRMRVACSLVVVMCFGGLVVLQSSPASAGLRDRIPGTKAQKALDNEATGVSGEEKPAAEGVYEGPKKIIAATKFKSTVGAQPDCGEATGAMLSEALMATGRFIVVERAEVADIVKEQDMGVEGRITQATAAKFGNMLGASILVMGTVTQYEEQAAGRGGGVGLPIPGVGGSVSLGGNKMTAFVKVNIRLVDTETGKILSTHNADGTAESKGRRLGGGIRGVSAQGNTSTKTPIGQALQKAIDEAVAHISKTMEGVPFFAKVADVSGSEIIINAGTNRNMKEGMVLTGYKIVKEIKDPDTGLVMAVKEEATGKIKIDRTEEKISYATKTEGSISMGQKLKLN